MKELARFFDPDSRNLAFVRMDPNSGETTPRTLDDHYQLVSTVNLHDGIPDEVRSYFETVKTLILYGWLHYPFYALSQTFCGMAVEIALRVRLPKPGNDKRGLANLFGEAQAKGLITAQDFPIEPYRKIRNSFVHAKGHWILPPGYAIDTLILSAKLINSLWSAPA